MQSYSAGTFETGPMTLRRLHAQLRLHRWRHSNKRRPGIKRLYPDLDTALTQIQLHDLGPLPATTPPGRATVW